MMEGKDDFMEKEQFAKLLGYPSFYQLQNASTYSLIDMDSSYYITPTPQGWVVWCDAEEHMNQANMVMFSTQREARFYLHALLKELQ
ncbi:hypothetical protein MM817_02989 [Acidibacillus sp. S0AB]|uniref:Uncharacterized protein n=2 Tax=Sulfoacidibacillus ferrooxidans TaxID=2005001 RepID=A0A9X2AFQ4_9BACL|nr:hypothetical protein [Sulfoacidibacillus ferrooxidans]